MNYLEQQALWNAMFGDAVIKLFCIMITIVVVRTILQNKMIFKLLVIATFFVPITLIEVIRFVKG
ncbi:TPA: hypothetical protein ACUJUF_001514 [Streptococcus agalactiae]|nr:hypothetical protein [Streptococcus agalactiae]